MDLLKDINEIKIGLSIVFDDVKLLKNVNLEGVKEEGYPNMFVDGTLLVLFIAINLMEDFERNMKKEKTSTPS